MTVAPSRGGHRVLITGGDGMLARGFREVLRDVPDVDVSAPSRHALDVTDRMAVEQWRDWSPSVIVHCAGQALADACERDPAAARLVHVEGTRHVAALARVCGSRLVYPQSVFIFDGRELPVTEETVSHPPFEYGRLKLEAERLVLETVPTALSVRMAGFFGGDDKDKNFVGQFTNHLRQMLVTGDRSCAVGDRVWQPTYTVDLARNTWLLVDKQCAGIYHMGSFGEASFYEVATACVALLGLGDRIEVNRVSAASVSGGEPARRPQRMVTATRRLDREGLNVQRWWHDALAEYLARPWFDDLRRPEASQT